MRRANIIIGLLLIAAVFTYFAKITRGVLELFVPQGRAPITTRHLPPETSSLFTQLINQWQRTKRHLSHKKQRSAHVKITDTRSLTTAPKPTGPVVLQILPQEDITHFHNAALGDDASARLSQFLQQRHQNHTQISNATAALFGQAAQQEVIAVLVQDEQISYRNALTSKTAREFARRQERTDAHTQARLQHIFEKHKVNFNSRLHTGNAAWDKFFHRVNNFEKAAN